MTIGLWVDAGTGGLMILIGLLVLRGRPGARLNRAFCAWSVFLGTVFVSLNAALLLRGNVLWEQVLLWTTAFGILAAAPALVWLLLAFPGTLNLDDRRRLRRALIAIAGATIPFGMVAAAIALPNAGPWTSSLGYASRAAAPYAVILSGFQVYMAATFAFSAWMAVRFKSFSAEEPKRRLQCAYAVPSVTMYPLAFVGGTLLFPPATEAGLIDVFGIAALAAVWLYAGDAAQMPRPARAVAWFLLATPLLVLLLTLGGSLASIAVSGILGGSRLVGLAVLGYAILRHQMFDIDLKLKVTVRRSTVLAAFGAAFFLGSELLEELIPIESLVLGVAAAGAMSLALRPLKRFAERLADQLMPGVEASPVYLAGRKADVYRAAFESGIADEKVTVRERAMLNGLRRQLGLTIEEVAIIERSARA